MTRNDRKHTGSHTRPPDDELERRRPDQPDRRARPRGGRRAADAVKRLADFAYRLLTEPPR